jgi:hypothetical protein
MADQYLQTLTPEAQAAYETAERKKQVALAMMKNSAENPSLESRLSLKFVPHLLLRPCRITVPRL